MISRHLLIALILAAISASGCTGRDGHYTRDNKVYGQAGKSFKGHWQNYYERGRSFSEGEFFKEALADFKKAAGDRDQDQWHAQTDDNHFVDYFPHREMGVVYFRRKQYDEAISELKYSLQSAPSARGNFFLNKTRAAKLRMQGRDMFPPEVQVEGSSGKRLTNSSIYTIKGVAVDDTFVSSIQVGDRHIPLELAEKQHVFTAEVPLKEGENRIGIIATDLVGKATEQELKILCDRSGPTVEILQENAEGENRVVSGVVSDTGGLESLTVNGEPWKITGNFSAYSFKFALSKDGVKLVAQDRAGNVTLVNLREAEMDNDPLMHPYSGRLEPPAVPDGPQPLLSSNPTPSPDTDPPIILLKDLNPYQETYDDHILLEGMIADVSPIRSISVNGSSIPVKNGRKLYFSQLKNLNEGDNEFLIAATDIHGNRADKTIKITRKVRNILQTDSRLSVAILPFNLKGGISPVSERIDDRLIKSFQEQKRFNVIERKKVDAVLQKLALSRMDLAIPDKALEFGRIIGADTILRGDIIESAGSVEVIGHLIDTNTATILASNDIYGEDKNASSLDQLLDSLAFKFKQDFPLFEGIVMEVDNDEVLINIGSEKQIKPYRHLICYRKGLEIKHPITGEILDAEPEIIGELTVKEVFEQFSKASFRKQEGEVQKYDQVIAR